MPTNDVSATLDIRGGSQGGTEPWSKNAELTLDASGFHDPEGIGRAGDDPRPIAAAAAAAVLLQSFDRAELVGLLDHFVALRNAL
jgi:hypothetical protein